MEHNFILGRCIHCNQSAEDLETTGWVCHGHQSLMPDEGPTESARIDLHDRIESHDGDPTAIAEDLENNSVALNGTARYSTNSGSALIERKQGVGARTLLMAITIIILSAIVIAGIFIRIKRENAYVGQTYRTEDDRAALYFRTTDELEIRSENEIIVCSYTLESRGSIRVTATENGVQKAYYLSAEESGILGQNKGGHPVHFLSPSKYDELIERNRAEEEHCRQAAAEEERRRQAAAEEECRYQAAAEEALRNQVAAEEERRRQVAAEEERRRQVAAEEERRRQEIDREKEDAIRRYQINRGSRNGVSIEELMFQLGTKHFDEVNEALIEAQRIEKSWIEKTYDYDPKKAEELKGEYERDVAEREIRMKEEDAYQKERAMNPVGKREKYLYYTPEVLQSWRDYNAHMKHAGQSNGAKFNALSETKSSGHEIGKDSNQREGEEATAKLAAELVSAFLKHGESVDIQLELADYAATVNPYFDQGTKDKAAILKDITDYRARWTNRKFSLVTIESTNLVASDALTVTYRFQYAVSNGKRNLSGVQTHSVRYTRTADRWLVSGIQIIERVK